jgi:hypothetical protein
MSPSAPGEINRPEIVAELTAVFHAYEQALMSNDLPALDAFFWDDERVTRYGIADRQWGIAALRAYRAETPAPNFTRRLEHLRITTFGLDLGTAQVEFIRSDTALRGFQTQTWLRFPQGWKIVAAQVSMIAWPAGGAHSKVNTENEPETS